MAHKNLIDMERILITGGAGFIGSHLARALLKVGHSVRILDNLSPQVHGAIPEGLGWLRHEDHIEFVRGSIRNPEDVRVAITGMDVVVHLAAETGTGQSMYQVAHYNSVNVGGTALLLEALTNDSRRSIRRIVLASSRSIYGEGAYVCPACDRSRRVYPDARTKRQLEEHQWEHICVSCGNELQPVPTREDDPAKPASIYAATKYAQEDLVRVTCNALDLDYAILRLQNVYGEGQSLNNPYTGILSIFSTRIRRGQALPIFEDGLETRDFVHVEDVANVFLASVQAPATIRRVINVGSGVKTTVAEIAAKLSDSLGAKRNIAVTGEYRLGDIRHNFADTERMNSVLGYQPKISIETGMKRFAEWVSKQPLPEDQLQKANAELRARKLMA